MIKWHFEQFWEKFIKKCFLQKYEYEKKKLENGFYRWFICYIDKLISNPNRNWKSILEAMKKILLCQMKSQMKRDNQIFCFYIELIAKDNGMKNFPKNYSNFFLIIKNKMFFLM